MEEGSRTSRRRVVTEGRSAESDASASSLMSVANTAAPASARASAEARPMPWAAAVTSAVRPARSLSEKAFMRFPLRVRYADGSGLDLLESLPVEHDAVAGTTWRQGESLLDLEGLGDVALEPEA